MSGLKEPDVLVYLKPGEIFFSAKPSVVVTVLGSCLSVTMFHRSTGLGGICHGLLPRCENGNACRGGCGEEFRYVDCSIRKLVGLFDRRRIDRRELEVKYFGGADLFTRRTSRQAPVSVGRQNIATAEEILRSEGLKPHIVDVGGLQGRKILFYTNTGDVLLKRLKKAEERMPG